VSVRYLAAIVVLGLLATPIATADVPTTQPISQVVKPTLVTLDLDKVAAKDAFAELQKRSKIKVNIVPPDLLARSDTPITLKVKNRPWLEVMLELCDQAGVYPSNYGNNWNITQQGDRRLKARRVIDGPTMIVCHNATTDSEIRFGDAAKTVRTLTLQSMLFTEPGSPVSGISTVTDVVATDDLGRELKPVSTEPAIFSAGYERRDFTIALPLPDADATSIKRVSGKLLAAMLAESAELKIPDLLRKQGDTITFRSATFTVSEVRSVGNWYQVELEVSRGDLPLETFQRLRTNMPPFDPRAENEKQAGIIRVNQVQTRGEDQVLTLTVRPQNIGAPAQPKDEADKPVIDLAWTLPVSYRHVEIPFELTDLPIPR